MPSLTGKLITSSLGVLTPPNYGTATLALSGYSLSAICGGAVNVAVDRNYLFYSIGYAEFDTKGFLGELSGYSFAATCGGKSAVTLSGYSFSSAGSTDVRGSVEAELSGYTFSAAGTTDNVGRAQVFYIADYQLNALGGGYARATLPRPAVTASGPTDRLGYVRGVLPLPGLVASGSQDAHGSVVGVLPGLEIAPNGVLRATLPRTLVLITGGVASTTYEAYNFTLVDAKEGTQAYASHYTDYPFDRIVRFHDRYYGVNSSGLYELGGDTFSGEDIVSVLQTGVNDFKQRELKSPVSIYLGGRVAADFKATVISAEVKENHYTFHPAVRTGARNYRIKVGRGIRARYLAYRLTNTNGGDFEIDDLTCEYVVSQRRTA